MKLPLPYLIVAFCCLVTAAGTSAQTDDRPNIVFIVAEDMSSKVGAFGDSVANTPTLDAMAAEGVRYTNFYTTAGVCSPSRASFITGMYPISIGAQHMRTRDKKYETVPPAEVKAFPELLRQAGYSTANVAKRDYQFGEPFTIWDVDVGDNRSAPDLAVWRQLPSDKPFFAMINLLSTHETRLGPRDADTPHPRFGPLLIHMGHWVSKNVAQITDPATVTVPPYLPETDITRKYVAQMYDLIHYMDSEVAQILANLTSDGLLDNTLVIWTTDNGDSFPRGKRATYDSGIKLPMIVRYPDGKNSGTVNDKLVSSVDLAPTFLNLAGVTPPTFTQGHDFLGDTTRDYVFAARDRMTDVPDRVRIARDKRFKYVRNYAANEPYFRPLAFRDMFPLMQELWRAKDENRLTPVQRFYFTAPRPAEELYDTANDPFEVVNLADDPDYLDVLDRMRLAMDEWIKEVGDLGELTEEAMIAKMWGGKTQPKTEPPEVSTIRNEGHVIVSLSSATPGASIGYRILSNDEDAKSWLLYNEPITLNASEVIETKAIRYGYRESSAVQYPNLSIPNN